MSEILVETDVLACFLIAPAAQPSVLRLLLESATCFTTFINAAELYSIPKDDAERRTVERALFGIKILGASGRYAKTIGRILSSLLSPDGITDYRTAIIAAMCQEGRLPVVTDSHYDVYSRIPGMIVLQGDDVRRFSTPTALAGHIKMLRTGMHR
ncbi:MAG TPA: hypothetical protein VHI13_12450 [Candidatus Kapabacteria bacterium]|nr:hypothetical protein [Candidatus Kapabacteria bacterium]